jgi:diguanylate cyclase (GGDEF)-like protein
MDRLIEQGKLKNYETWVRARSGRGVPASLSASLLYDRDGKVVGTLGVLKDITRQKEMEEKLNYTIEKLQEANEKLEYLAVTDNLSGLYNHRHFYRRLEEEVERSARTKRPLSLLLIDIDRFKTFNDRYGHQVGDRVITEIGRVIWTCIRRVDTGCRYGGEEFTVVLPETRMEQASIVADRIRAAFAGSPLFRELGVDPATLSAGVAEYRPEGGRASAEEIVRAADEAMYRVKHGGGDGIATALLEGPSGEGEEEEEKGRAAPKAGGREEGGPSQG